MGRGILHKYSISRDYTPPQRHGWLGQQRICCNYPE